MSVIDRYILKQLVTGFLTVLLFFAGLVWVTQVLRTVDLSVSLQSNASLLVSLSAFMLPPLVLIIIPFALLLSTVWLINKMHADSEWVVLAASGATPWQRLRPFLHFAIVMALVVAALSLYVVPLSQKQFRLFLTEMRADFISHFLEPGVFKTMEDDLIFHVANKSTGGALDGLFIRDLRDDDLVQTYLAERGQIVRAGERTFLMMQEGTIARESTNSGRISLVSFQSYALDLSDFSNVQSSVYFKPRERSTAELLSLDKTDEVVAFFYGRFVSELHDRFAQPLYPILLLLAAFIVLKRPRNTRQGRVVMLVIAVGVAIVLRLLGFGAANVARGSPELAPVLIYGVPLVCLGVLIYVFFTPKLRLE